MSNNRVVSVTAIFTSLIISILKMIRRLVSTFIELPNSNLLNSEFLPHSSNLSQRNYFREPQLHYLNWLCDAAPCFPVDGSKIRVINEPQDFYNAVLEKASAAKFRIMLASLYLGIEKLETDLVKSIEHNLKENVSLQVDILLDYTRGTRGKHNSKTMLMPLIQNSRNCRLSLYHTPVLRGITKKLAPARWNELLGLQHMKLYLFDDTVIMSGANLSNDYFTNRQDRYVMVEDKNLANFFSEFMGKVQEFSLQVHQNGDINLHDNWKMLPYKSSHNEFANEAKNRIQGFFHSAHEKQKLAMESNQDADTWIFPTVEMGQLNIHHDSIVTKKILQCPPKESTLKIATGYFNLTENYMDCLVNECQANCSILMAHPNANGFQGAKGPAGGIPAAYSLIARRFLESIRNKSQDHRFSLLEYERDQWTYHAKGLWLYPPNSSLPHLTVIGSSNYGERSVNRDLESQICVVTTNKNLQRALQNEYNHIFSHATTAENQLVDRTIPNWVKVVVGLFKNFF